MSMTALLFGFAMIDNLLLLFINIYNIITLSDLEIDLMNVRQACNKLNQVRIYSLIVLYFKRQPGQLGIYDPLEINNRRNIKANMRDFLIRLIFYLLCFFLYLFFSIIKPLNVAFFGSDLFSMHILEHLHKLFINDKSRIKHLEVVTTVSSSNTVMHGAEKLQLITHTWSNIDSLISKSSVQFDLGILASFGQLLPKKLIESFPLGIINVHPSLLPRWRGSSPLIYTIASGDKIGGVSIMDIRPKHFDIGSILMQQSFPLSTNITMSELLKMTANIGCSLLTTVLEDPIKARQNAQEQSLSGVTYAHKLNKYAFYIDWCNHTIEDIDRLYRALNGIANLRTSFRQKPVRLKLLTLINDQNIIDNLNVISSQPGTAIYNKSLECICIRCKNGWIGFQKLAYRKLMYARDFQNGYISKTDRFVFDSIHNPLFDHIYDRRLPS
ncbi:unnamed protein product [Rotaria sordida]|uniref:Methionyl-tRNA formyltransferase, mitochondrial n=1 Tax=Rotaria sordida TaxID=392033 RepID=A0A819D4X6_9BILA|nr:unnamed protein product [Rotaria sordida]